MTILAKTLINRIAADGPISVGEYIHSCLYDRKHGYYRTQNAIGRGGDFITAPEISQIFGELIGIWGIAVWQSMGQPSGLKVIELGPGRGTLLADAWRSFQLVPEFAADLTVHCVEVSPVLREQQAATFETAGVPRVTWHEDLDSIASGPAVLIANEFLDTFPVQQFVFDGKWHERMIGLNERGQLNFITGPSRPDLSIPISSPSPGDIFETMPGLGGFTETLARRASPNSPMAALFIDYGHDRTAVGETLQAVQGHESVPALHDPGQCDLSAHVDFEAFAQLAIEAGLARSPVLTQSRFLSAMGILERARALASGSAPAQINSIESAVARLITEPGMGSMFKAIAIHSPHVPLPFPFSAAANL